MKYCFMVLQKLAIVLQSAASHAGRVEELNPKER